MNRKEFKEKFLVINWKRMEEINDGFYKSKYFPPPEDSPPVKRLTKALKEFSEDYEDYTGNKLNQKYYVCNQDEPYAQDVIDIILTDGESIKLKLKDARVDENERWLNNLKQTGFNWVEISKTVIENRIKELTGE